jgi:alkanesulfonate monooxygenase SsuD/methylene tetrahydromethanopterin reductase-like flavin-dependent oxidoreductase (luciferase family)
VAEEFAMIDCISGGRLIAGFPVGTPMDTCYAYGQNPSQLRERYHEAHDLVLKAWTEPETFAFNGRFNQQRYVNIWPVGVAESREQALELYTEPAEYFYGRCLHVDARFATPPGYSTEATQRAGIQGMVAQAANIASYKDKMKLRAREMSQIVDGGYVIIGSPDEVAEQLKNVATNLNVGHLMMLLQFGNMKKDLAAYNTRLFAEKVMPQIKGLFDDQWKDHWWPEPMAAAERAVPAGLPGSKPA